jgi:adenylate cyclase
MTKEDQQNTSLTILFADIVGSSHVYDVLGDQQAQKIISDILQELSHIVSDGGGTVCKTIGDEIMCTFMDVDRTVDAALKMQEMMGIQSFSDDIDLGSTALRIGFFFGPVIFEDGDYFGNAVNVASRIVSLAKPRQILTTSTTLAQAPNAGDYTTRFVEKTTVKGIQEEFAIYEMLSEDDPEQITRVFSEQAANGKQKNARLKLIFHNKEIIMDSGRSSLTLGRSVDNDIIVHNDAVSRFHAQVECRKGRFFLVDKSVNGTYLSEKEKEPQKIHRDESSMSGSGFISLGQPKEEQPEDVVEYKVI